MINPSIEEVIKTSTVIIRKGRYAYLKTNEKDLKNHLMISQDQDETTVITEEQNLPSVKYEEEVKWFKLIEIKVSIPFLKGFIAKVTNIIASKGCNTLVVSTFSKDYILTKEENISEAISAMEEAGFTIQEE